MVLAGWFGVFPEIPGYRRSFLDPVVGPGMEPAAYLQTARYEWTGGAVKVLSLTLARDPAFRREYADETLARGAASHHRVRVGGRTGWLRVPGQDAAGMPTEGPRWLIVPLTPEDALVLEAEGPGPWERLTDLAGRLDLGQIEAALRSPPRTDFRRKASAFRALRAGCSVPDVLAWLGPADTVTDGAARVLTYHLDDGSRVILGVVDPGGLLYARHVRGPANVSGDVIELIDEPAREPMDHPPEDLP